MNGRGTGLTITGGGERERGGRITAKVANEEDEGSLQPSVLHSQRGGSRARQCDARRIPWRRRATEDGMLDGLFRICIIIYLYSEKMMCSMDTCTQAPA